MIASLNGFKCTCLGALMVALSGCVSLSTFQSPNTVDEGATELGLGISFMNAAGEEDFFLGETALIGRHGLGERMDVGAKLWATPAVLIVPATLGVYGDVRYQIIRDPVYVSASMGVSYFSAGTADDDTFRMETAAIYPTLMAGTRQLYAGVKWTRMFATTDAFDDVLGEGFPGLVAGTRLGSRFIFMPELNIHFGEQTVFLPGAAFQLGF